MELNLTNVSCYQNITPISCYDTSVHLSKLDWTMLVLFFIFFIGWFIYAVEKDRRQEDD